MLTAAVYGNSEHPRNRAKQNCRRRVQQRQQRQYQHQLHTLGCRFKEQLHLEIQQQQRHHRLRLFSEYPNRIVHSVDKSGVLVLLVWQPFLPASLTFETIKPVRVLFDVAFWSTVLRLLSASLAVSATARLFSYLRQCTGKFIQYRSRL